MPVEIFITGMKLFKYILPDGTIVRFDESIQKIDYGPLIPYNGTEAKILYLPSENPDDIGESTVEMKVIKWVNHGFVTFE